MKIIYIYLNFILVIYKILTATSASTELKKTEDSDSIIENVSYNSNHENYIFNVPIDNNKIRKYKKTTHNKKLILNRNELLDTYNNSTDKDMQEVITNYLNINDDFDEKEPGGIFGECKINKNVKLKVTQIVINKDSKIIKTQEQSNNKIYKNKWFGLSKFFKKKESTIKKTFKK